MAALALGLIVGHFRTKTESIVICRRQVDVSAGRRVPVMSAGYHLGHVVVVTRTYQS